MTERNKPADDNSPSQERLDWIGEEYLKLAPELETEMELSDWGAYRKGLLKTLQVRRRQDRGFARLASQLNAKMHARGESMEHLAWPDTVGRRAYGEIFLRLQLYRADVAIANLKEHGEKRRWQNYDRMEAGAFAAFEEMREQTLKRMRATEGEHPIVAAIAAEGYSWIMGEKKGD